ncbi:hypothetical protein WME73_37830 [Sorangium sp. So ce302]|uniref:hypothetical protein n=1 Tax=Sorangium sp. So ce302 TaxID=3133297 RepID=UPI003F63C0FC
MAPSLFDGAFSASCSRCASTFSISSAAATQASTTCASGPSGVFSFLSSFSDASSSRDGSSLASPAWSP